MSGITKAQIDTLLQSSSVDSLSAEQLFELFRSEETLKQYAPEGVCQVDPRDGAMVIYNSSRSKRPHDYRAPASEDKQNTPAKCPICAGQTTGIVDVAPLSEGHTFINKNMFPCVYPVNRGRGSTGVAVAGLDGGLGAKTSLGLHFLQWTSSQHQSDWHTMPLDDLSIVLKRLAKLEGKLMLESDGIMPATGRWHGSKETFGFVSIIKNYGAAVGGSLSHGHQQVVFGNVLPSHLYNNWRFFEQNSRCFSEHLLTVSPNELVVRDYGATKWIVPYFMKRPYSTILAIKNTDRQFLFELDDRELRAVAQGWSDAARSYARIMPALGREFVYNAVVHNGPGAGLYIEFLPFTQETGGYEQLGLWVCQDNPDNVAERLRSLDIA